MARLRVEIVAAAEREAHQAFVWYFERNPEAARRFEDGLVNALGRIAEAPFTGAEVDVDLRRVLLVRFPYGILYAVETDYLLVVAVMHLHRRPGYWRARRGSR